MEEYLAGKRLIGVPFIRNRQTCVKAQCQCGSIWEYKLSYLKFNKDNITFCKNCNGGRKSQLKNLTMVKINKLLAIEYLGHNQWKVLCDCGKICYMTGGAFRSGKRKSCGCIRKNKS